MDSDIFRLGQLYYSCFSLSRSIGNCPYGTSIFQPLVNNGVEGILHEVNVKRVELLLLRDLTQRAGQRSGVLGRNPPQGGVGGHPPVAGAHLHAVEPLVHVCVLDVSVQLSQGMNSENRLIECSYPSNFFFCDPVVL